MAVPSRRLREQPQRDDKGAQRRNKREVRRSRRGPSQDDRIIAAFAYAGQLVARLAAPIAIYVIARRGSAYVRHHGAQGINAGITMIVVMVGSFLLGVVGVAGFEAPGLLFVLVPLLIAYQLVILGYLVVASVRAYQGVRYEYPFWIAVPFLR